MKIKKMTITMLVVAALAAVIGISAVSYAAWTAGNNSFGASAATGTVQLVGFTGDTTNIEFDPVVPYNQTGTITNGEKMQSITLPEFVVTGEYTITVKSGIDLTFYVKTENTATPSTTAPTSLDGWTEVTSAGTAMDGKTFAADTGVEYMTVTDQVLYLVLDDSNKDNMNRTDITLTVTLNLKTTA